ncbi:hypothetical protein NRB20_35540 [Nocardia sp. RB20]|uniref:Uncharacterized protein n=1 Tax=Nocardia macrotermitis TaxID=2585198 RepID=A0A7K0D403_9NOCA|nr:hypothetical protein [Nocardia macrotermitis]
MVMLGANVNGVYGNIQFKNLNDQTVQAGARTLTDMLRMMTK